MSRNLECTLIYQIGIEIYDKIKILRNWSEVKLHRAFLLELGSKGSKQVGPLQKLACMFLCQTGIQISDQISNTRIWSKVKLHHLISLMFGLKEGKMALRNWKQLQPFRPSFHQVHLRSKITRNPLKVCMHGYLSNGYLNYDKVKKIKTLKPFLDQP